MQFSRETQKLQVKVFREGQESRSSSSIPPPSLIPDVSFEKIYDIISLENMCIFDRLPSHIEATEYGSMIYVNNTMNIKCCR